MTECLEFSPISSISTAPEEVNVIPDLLDFSSVVSVRTGPEKISEFPKPLGFSIISSASTVPNEIPKAPCTPVPEMTRWNSSDAIERAISLIGLQDTSKQCFPSAPTTIAERDIPESKKAEVSPARRIFEIPESFESGRALMSVLEMPRLRSGPISFDFGPTAWGSVEPPKTESASPSTSAPTEEESGTSQKLRKSLLPILIKKQNCSPGVIVPSVPGWKLKKQRNHR